jgi:hypothetical protein
VCRRDNSATTQPRTGVRVNPAESAAAVSIGQVFIILGLVITIWRSIAQTQPRTDRLS